MKLRSLLPALIFLPHLTASALTIQVGAGVLQDDLGHPMSTGVVVLTAAPSGTFHGPYGSSFTSGDERELAVWNFSDGGFDGIFGNLTADLSFGSGWGPDDPLRLYWYPTLTFGGTLAAGMPFGTYSGVDWITPGDPGPFGEAFNLLFVTSDIGGDVDPGAGTAANFVPPTGTAVPETGGTLVLLSAGLAGMVAVRRFRRRQAGA